MTTNCVQQIRAEETRSEVLFEETFFPLQIYLEKCLGYWSESEIKSA